MRGAAVKGFGSYLSPTFSKRLLSSSKTDLFESKVFKISDGCDRNSSRSSILGKRAFFPTLPTELLLFSFTISLLVDDKLVAMTLEEPDHFSYFSSKALILCSKSIEGLHGDCKGDSSESDVLSLGPGDKGVSKIILPTSLGSGFTVVVLLLPPVKGGERNKLLLPFGDVEAARGDM